MKNQYISLKVLSLLLAVTLSFIRCNSTECEMYH